MAGEYCRSSSKEDPGSSDSHSPPTQSESLGRQLPPHICCSSISYSRSRPQRGLAAQSWTAPRIAGGCVLSHRQFIFPPLGWDCDIAARALGVESGSEAGDMRLLFASFSYERTSFEFCKLEPYACPDPLGVHA